MKCPACGSEQIDGMVRCSSCGRLLPGVQSTSRPPDVGLDRVAVVSSICALAGVILFVPGLIAQIDPTILRPESALAVLAALASLLAMGAAFLLGIAGLLEITTSGGRRTGYGFAVVGMAIPIVLVLPLLLCLSVFTGVHGTAYRMTCAANLSGIGKAMLIYANDHNDHLPAAGGPGARWSARLASWSARNRIDAYGLGGPNADDGQASVSASLYLLVKYGGVAPEKFVCRNDRKAKEFKPGKYGLGDREAFTLWDFGPNPPLHCSYAYHMPYSSYRLTTSLPPGFAVSADRNPWMDSPSARAADFSRYMPDISPYRGTSEQAKYGNAATHERDGQNVLFLDTHVEFAKRAYCGIKDDNIYTISTHLAAGDILGTAPRLGSQPANAKDSLLVNDPVAP
jgi:hypothetical protein